MSELTWIPTLANVRAPIARLSNRTTTIEMRQHTRADPDRGHRETGMVAEIRIHGKLVVVEFSHASKLYARAEAARCYAMILDTIGDFQESGDDPLVIDEPSLDGATVEITGDQAAIALVGLFGDEFANLVC